MNIFENLKRVLSQDERFVDENGSLLRNKVRESAIV